MRIVARIIVPLFSTALAAGVAHAQSAEFLFELGTGARGSADGEFNTAVGVAVDSTNRIFVADNVNDRVQFFDPAGNFIDKFGTPGSGPGQFNQVVSIAIDALDRVFVGDQFNGRVQVFDSSGTFLSEFGTGLFRAPGGLGIAFDSANNIIVSDELNHRILLLDPLGNLVGQFGSSGSGNGQFNRPRGVAVDSADRIIVADILNRRVQVFVSAN